MPEVLRLSHDGPSVAAWLCHPLAVEVRRSLERTASLPDVRRIAVMPDVHLAESICVGVALATSDLVYPQAVGGDIGCGMLAQAFDADHDALGNERDRREVLSAIGRAVPILRHRRAVHNVELPAVLDPGRLSRERLATLARRVGTIELGTLGRGNHFVELQRELDGGLWLMIHSGSRGMGQAVFAAHQPSDRPSAHWSISAETHEGAAYLADAAWCVEYARANRAAMAEIVGSVLREMIGARPVQDTAIDVPHNFVRRETHDGVELLVHRKGAAPAGADQPGVIPGSMGAPSFHVRGRGCAESLCSSSHGAGRALARGEAFRRISPREFARQTAWVTVDPRQTERLRDEAPGAYKDIRSVMRAQRDLVAITRELRPILTLKGT